MLDSQELWEYFTNLTHFKEDLEQKSEFATFWSNFLEMIQIMVNLIYVTRGS